MNNSIKLLFTACLCFVGHFAFANTHQVDLDWAAAYSSQYTITPNGILLAKIKKDTDPKKTTRPVPKIAKPVYDKVPPPPKPPRPNANQGKTTKPVYDKVPALTQTPPAKPPRPNATTSNGSGMRISGPMNVRKMNDPKATQRNNLINQMEREKQQLRQQQANERTDLNNNANKLLSVPRGVQAEKQQQIQANQKELNKLNSIKQANPNMGILTKNTAKPIVKENKQLQKDIKVAQNKEQKILSQIPKAQSKQAKTHAAQTTKQQKTQKATIKSVASRQASQMKKAGTKVKTSKPKRRKH